MTESNVSWQIFINLNLTVAIFDVEFCLYLSFAWRVAHAWTISTQPQAHHRQQRSVVGAIRSCDCTPCRQPQKQNLPCSQQQSQFRVSFDQEKTTPTTRTHSKPTPIEVWFNNIEFSVPFLFDEQYSIIYVLFRFVRGAWTHPLRHARDPGSHWSIQPGHTWCGRKRV